MGSGVSHDVQVRAATPAMSLDPESLRQVEAYENQMSSPIADAYNNLGAMAAGDNQFTSALEYFQQAAVWNPSLEGLDYNWGRAGFSALQYSIAAPALERYLKTHPGDKVMRSALGSSLFNLKKYAEAAQVLRPLESEISSNSRLDYIFSVCLLRSGDITTAIARLQAQERTLPKLADVHSALSEAYAMQGDEARAADEAKTAIELNPSDRSAKHQLA